MPKPVSQVREARRFEGEDQGTELVSWLNQKAPLTPDRQRIAHLLLLLRELPEAIAAAQRADSAHPLLVQSTSASMNKYLGDRTSVERYQIATGAIGVEHMSRGDLVGYLPIGLRSRVREAVADILQDLRATLRSGMDEPLRALTDLLLKLNRMMRRYPSHSVVLATPSGVEWDRAGRGGRKVTLDEWDAFCTIAELGRGGLLERVRQCPVCSKWVFARFSHQRFCSPACQIKQFRSSKEWKAKAARKARERYRKKKERKART